MGNFWSPTTEAEVAGFALWVGCNSPLFISELVEMDINYIYTAGFIIVQRVMQGRLAYHHFVCRHLFR